MSRARHSAHFGSKQGELIANLTSVLVYIRLDLLFCYVGAIAVQGLLPCVCERYKGLVGQPNTGSLKHASMAITS